jgi:KUP system potassium uptake protein
MATSSSDPTQAGLASPRAVGPGAAREGGARASRPPPAARRGHGGEEVGGKALALLALGALGVVYGDIGTSPLYALKECFTGPHGVPPTRANVMGVLSLVFWALTFVVSFKYILFVMRADNRGEGGIMALLALVGRRRTSAPARRALLVAGLFGAALLYGDGAITPAISVLGAMEGLEVATPAVTPFVVPLSVGVLLVLFLFQKRGTGAVGAVFGPVMLVWFACLALLGLRGIAQSPGILAALSPHFAAGFFLEHRLHALLVLGGVVLVVTGGEALYADMGHFGRHPIRLAWFALVMPALLLDYFGQGAVLLRDPGAAANPFYLSAPAWSLYPLVAVATLAAVVASQALISGAFSLTHQAVQLGYCPLVTIRHTSYTAYGQIYIPWVNWLLGVSCVALVLGFRSSGGLAAAYGIAVTGTMTITTLLFHRVMRDRWRWRRWQALPLTLLFLTVDLAFLTANVVKIEKGGWLPLAVGAAVFLLMSTWKQGRELLGERLRGSGMPLDEFLVELERDPPQRIRGTAVILSPHPGTVPRVLLHHLRHNLVLHERVILLYVWPYDAPTAPAGERFTVQDLGGGLFQVIGRFGFMETPDVPTLLGSLPETSLRGARIDPAGGASYYLGRETVLPTGPGKMGRWRKRVFIRMARNAPSTASFFVLPLQRVVEVGEYVQI